MRTILPWVSPLLHEVNGNDGAGSCFNYPEHFVIGSIHFELAYYSGRCLPMHIF